ncbi:unnamed protein product [Rotaria magnacalcarata]|uniref:Uncharacterized protein n=1 Tax=Rotaria magnacalcarata TaxID=392030 RepID=A0A819KTY2_9BILA|nr:unnamed protein product [Rotaria magnacalcarata]CAF3918293.1 unnamed protein product [Rotaria magnacalcarata]CAF3930209.1 unnamed protein product [Rotaria magnacalcarata]CAF3952644.1 unnamed protein product [Rotaria magnacalcarata]
MTHKSSSSSVLSNAPSSLHFIEARRQAAAAAATQRLQQLETRGVDQDEYRRLNQRRIEQERIEQQMKAQKQNNNNDGGLRWQMN